MYNKYMPTGALIVKFKYVVSKMKYVCLYKKLMVHLNYEVIS